MRKIIAVLISIIFLTVLAPTSLSDTEDINVTLTPSGNISINVDQSSWEPSVAIGGSTATGTSWANLDNDGNVQVDVMVNGSDTAAWALDTSPAHDQFQMQYGITTGGGGTNSYIYRPSGDYNLPASNRIYTGTGGQTNYYQQVDESVLDTGDRIWWTYPFEWPGSRITFTMSGTGSGTITGVTITGRIHTDEGTCAIKYVLEHSGSFYNSSEIILTHPFNTYSNYTFTTCPWTSSPWTWTDISEMHAGIIQHDSPGGGNVDLYQFYMAVNASSSSTTWTDILTSPATFENNLAWDQSKDFGLQVFMPTSSSSGGGQYLKITFVATPD